MGKRKDSSAVHSLEDPGSSSHRKHKKHKKKHKKRSHEDEDHPETVSDIGGSPKTAIKLKLKIGGMTLSTKNVVTQDDSDQLISVTDESIDRFDKDDSDIKSTDVDDTFVTKKPGDETSDEEREWLEALEKGELDDFGHLKKEKDPSLLTARQRALLHGKTEETLLELPSGYKTESLTEEQILKRQQRAKKRRQQAQEKREKDKKLTLERLLKKQEAKSKGMKGRSKKSDVPKYHYVNSFSGISISCPQGFPFPFTAHASRVPHPYPVKCGVPGCKNKKKYSCSKTGVPLCSLECYKKNLSTHMVSRTIT
ncbi:hypothetical protein ACJMK2_011140 [Sinanodonta woodiana]|uniref:INO80 complex subunit B-like conserved region domain-containing protein n=1 Tax=Sinanodonta woodiana TaxID=1069815 RepID=A0ABD3V767_SINWO